MSDVKVGALLAVATVAAGATWAWSHFKARRAAAAAATADDVPELDEKKTVEALQKVMTQTGEAVKSIVGGIMKFRGQLPEQQLDMMFMQAMQEKLPAQQEKMHKELGITPTELRAAALYWQEKSPQVLMLCDKIVQSLTQLIGPPPVTAKVPERITLKEFEKMFTTFLEQQRRLCVQVAEQTKKMAMPGTMMFQQTFQAMMAKSSLHHKISFVKQQGLTQAEFRACISKYEKAPTVGAILQSHMAKQQQLEAMIGVSPQRM